MCGAFKPRSGPEGAGLPGAATERLSTGAAAWLCVAPATFCYQTTSPWRSSKAIFSFVKGHASPVRTTSTDSRGGVLSGVLHMV